MNDDSCFVYVGVQKRLWLSLLRRSSFLFFMVVAGVALALAALAAEPPTAEDVEHLMQEHPLTFETWPLWRDVYVRLYLIDVGESQEFYQQLNRFHGPESQEPEHVEWQSDPIYWVLKTHAYLNVSEPLESESSSVEFARKALGLGDPEGISSLNLATALIRKAREGLAFNSLSDTNSQRLAEAESLLDEVSRKSPHASLSQWHGMISLLRNDPNRAKELFKQATAERPGKEWIASQYLSLVLRDDPEPHTKVDMTRQFVERFPNSAAIHAWHSLTLFSSQSFADAATELEHSRRLGDVAEKILAPELIQAIQEYASLAKEAIAGFKAFNEKNYALATSMLREAWSKGSRTLPVAHGLMYSQLNQIRSRPSKLRASEMVREFTSLVSAFPEEGELEAGRGVALVYASDYQEAQKAFNRSRKLGTDVNKIVGAESLRHVSEEARKEAGQQELNEKVRVATTGTAWFVAGLLTWIGVMFCVGMLLAVLIPRTPEASDLAEMYISSREIWLERFYLVILGISLVLFYLSVPFVTLGILAVSLALFGLLMVLRILHLGVLYRGFWATWHMLRMVFWGPSSDHFGLEAKEEDHPRLFAELTAVAQEIDTRVVDRVFLVPSSVVAVSQEGVGPFGLFGRRSRVLHLGVSILPWLTHDEFRSILAHEYAHFSRHDPFVYRFVFQVSSTLANSMAVMKAAAGSLNYINPFYAFYWLYLRGYGLLSAGYSRSREFLADRRAVTAYGKQPFISGLSKICQEGDLFEFFAYNNTARLLMEGNSFLNVFDSYREFREQPESVDHRIKRLEQILETKSTWFDSHPTLDERIAAASSFPETTGSQDSTSALDLLSDFKVVEERLTKLLTDRIHQQLILQS